MYWVSIQRVLNRVPISFCRALSYTKNGPGFGSHPGIVQIRDQIYISSFRFHKIESVRSG